MKKPRSCPLTSMTECHSCKYVLLGTEWVLYPNEVKKARVEADYKMFNSKKQINKCMVYEKQKIIS